MTLAAVAFGLAACGAGGTSGANEVASLSGGTTTSAASPAGGARAGGAGGDDRFYEFAKCMRGKGIEVPDPEPGGGPVRFGAGTGIDMNDPKFEEARAACTKELGDLIPGGNDPARRQEFQDRALAFAKCMRDNGVDMPDPTFGEGGRIEQRGPRMSRDDPKFEETSKKCESLLPFRAGTTSTTGNGS